MFGSSGSTIWGSISNFFGEAYDYVALAYKDFSAGYEFGDEDPGNQSFWYKAGDYVEDAFDFGGKLSAAWEASQSAKGLTSLQGFAAPRVSADKTYNPGTFRANKVNPNSVGYADPRVQAARAKISNGMTSGSKSMQRMVAGNIKQGRLNMSIPMTGSINVPTKTKLPKMPGSTSVS